MKNEAITICVGDNALKFLEITLPQNINFFDSYIVITSESDIKTQRFCENFPITILITDVLYKNKAKFNKGAAYNEAFKILTDKDEITILDCDSFIPDKLGNVIKNGKFNIECMYSSRRIIIPKEKDFIAILKGNTDLENSLWCCDGIGWGYMQMFNYNAQSLKKFGLFYPDSADTSEADWKFRNFYFGETTPDFKGYIGNLKEIPERIWHLGDPNMQGGQSFFKK